MRGIVRIDKGFFQECRAQQQNSLDRFTQLAQVEPSDVRKRSAQLAQELSFGRRQLSPDNPFILRHAGHCLALEREFAARNLKRGETIEATFFSSADDTPLFPVFLATQIISGILAASLVPYLVAAEIPTTSHVVEKITMSDTASDRQLNQIDDGTALPKTRISRTEGSTKLKQYGRMLEIAYSVMRTMSLDIVQLYLARMGRQVGIDQTDDLLETIISGDGTSGSAVTDTDAEATGVLDYDELVRLLQAFPLGYEMRHAVVNDTYLRVILNMAEFKDPMAGFTFTRDGALPGALGAMWHRWTSTGSTSFGTDRIVAVDNRMAIAWFREGDFLEESDQIIDRQVHQRTMSEWVGPQKLDNNASQCLDIVT